MVLTDTRPSGTESPNPDTRRSCHTLRIYARTGVRDSAVFSYVQWRFLFRISENGRNRAATLVVAGVVLRTDHSHDSRPSRRGRYSKLNVTFGGFVEPNAVDYRAEDRFRGPCLPDTFSINEHLGEVVSPVSLCIPGYGMWVLTHPTFDGSLVKRPDFRTRFSQGSDPYRCVDAG